MSSDEESDSFETRQRKRRGPVVQSDDDDPSSDDSLIMPRQKGVRRVLSSSSSSSGSGQSDSGSEIEAGSSRRRSRVKHKAVVQSSDGESDSSSVGATGNGCPICLGKLDGATLQGRPDECEHTFCFECIVAWSRNNSTCPLCRTAFRNIKILLQGAVIEEVPVKQITPEELDLNAYVNDIVCVICNSSDREDTLLLCDECDDAYHCACLSPPLASVPPGQWFCPRCLPGEIDDDENEGLLDGAEEDFSMYVPRTRATERVRRAVQSTRRTGAGRTSTQSRPTAGSSSGRRRASSAMTSASSRSSTTRRKTTSRGRKRKSTTSTKRRKTTRRKSRRGKGGRRKTIVRKAYASSVDHQCRIARSLGLSDRILNKLNRNSFGYNALSIDEPSTSRGAPAFESVKISRGPITGLVPDLHVFGNSKNFEPGGSDSESDVRGLPQQSNQKARTLSPPAPTGGDLLAGLLEKQSVLLSKKTELKRDSSGRVILVKDPVPSASKVNPGSSRRISITSSPTKPSPQPFVPEARPIVNKDGVDMHYKPSRVSRVDMSVVSKYESTIENVLYRVMSSSSQEDSRRLTPSLRQDALDAGLSSASNLCVERLREIADAAASATTIKTEPSELNIKSVDDEECPRIKQEVPSPPPQIKRDSDEGTGYVPIKIKVEGSGLYGPEQSRRTVVVGTDEGELNPVKFEAPAYADAEQNVVRKKAVRATHGWINSLRLTTPTVMNSLSAFGELDDNSPGVTVAPPLYARLSVKDEPREVPDFDLSRVKTEPVTFDEITPLPAHLGEKITSCSRFSGGSGTREGSSSKSVKSERHDDDRAFKDGHTRNKERSYDDWKSTSDSGTRELSRNIKIERDSDGTYLRHSRSKSPRLRKKERRSVDRSPRIKKERHSKDRSPQNSPRKNESGSRERAAPQIKKERLSRERSVPGNPRPIKEERYSREGSPRRVKRERFSQERSPATSPWIKKERCSTDRSPQRRRSHERNRKRSRSRSRDKTGDEHQTKSSRAEERERREHRLETSSRDRTRKSRSRSRDRTRDSRQTEDDKRGIRRSIDISNDGRRRKRSRSVDDRRPRRSPSGEDRRRRRSINAERRYKEQQRKQSPSPIGRELRQRRHASREHHQVAKGSCERGERHNWDVSGDEERRRTKSPPADAKRRRRSPTEETRKRGTSEGRGRGRTGVVGCTRGASSDEDIEGESRLPMKSAGRISHGEKTKQRNKNESVESSRVRAPKVELDHLKVEMPEFHDEDRPSSSYDAEMKTNEFVDEEKRKKSTVINEFGPCQSSEESAGAESRRNAQPPSGDHCRPKIEEPLNIVAPGRLEQSLPSSSVTPALSLALHGGRPVLLVPGPIAGTYVMPGAETEIQPPQPASSTTPSHHAEGYSSGVDSDDNILDSMELTTPLPGVDNRNNNNTPSVELKPPPERKVKEKLPKFFVDNAKFQEAVVKEVGSYLKKFYKKHQVSKEDYKEIFKKVMKKICKSSLEPKRLVCVRSIRKLCDFYVQKARLQIKKDCMFSDDVD